MDVVEYILDGLEAALELERELGVRSVEIDRGLLGATTAPRPPSKVLSPSGVTEGLKAKDLGRETRTGLEARDIRQGPVNQTIRQSGNQAILLATPSA